ncbi:hypothetical protein Hypma_008050 [Hypsizygus marmoreus]|uniref:Glycosyltransferase 61 catalytic domain-containing protein n=1 Tax=Hypsizygus marmoreus TaxID=39966 RepID=A0A369JY84_HYPMA|nr:hypothetical protein Hypma_008050 [Hypsizygus marmoreus]
MLDLGVSLVLPQTSVTAHAPGWTLYRNLYMSNGTLFIVTSHPEDSEFPEIRMMTSTGLPAFNTPENIALREPTALDMDFLSPEQAKRRWGGDPQNGQRNRIWTIEGNTLLFNDPPQFLNHYYHFVAELFFGTWAFLYGAFVSGAMSPSPSSISAAFQEPSFNLYSETAFQPPPLTRAIFIHASSDAWRDVPGFNAYFLRAAFPSLALETSGDWDDRVTATSVAPGSGHVTKGRAWHFPVAMLVDRSAAHRGDACGSRTQRTAAEAWELMIGKGSLDLVGIWWGSVRGAVLRFAGVDAKDMRDVAQETSGQVGDLPLSLPIPEKVLIVYITRQGVRRHLIEDDHLALVAALEEMVDRKESEGVEWELNVVQAETLTKDEQIKLAGRATILLGVHGNGLTHLVFMQPTRTSAVVEIFFPGGFSQDYEWTTRALGMRHFSVWNDTYFTHPNEPEVAYPDGFQGSSIPVHGPTVAKLIKDQLEGIL